ncbi:anti-CBASS protein Acb1 family protein [Sphingobium yanoikuyae]|uniref:anti-CBASS protein Acb1 family protein n=1 Tax=Sphingobium yanoikuyae TaxID=13690 RepID=UPI0026F32C98|nr:anti-CBASS Acb1 family protein [Sphingobium yanoikuyae]
MVGKSSIIANAAGFARDRLARAFPWFYGASTKHHFARDYGWPEELSFEQLYDLYCRYSLATAAVDKTIAKTWQTMPELWESEKPGKSAAEAVVAKHFAKRKIWRSLMDADRRSMVGAYAGAIILLRDGKQLFEPVDRVPRGIESLAGIIPAWEEQLTPLEYDQDQTSETYGEPLYFQYDEQAVGDTQAVGKSQVRIHRDRILIWSDDGTINCRSALEPGFNDVSDAAKIKGAGAEGFWKSARGAPIIEAPTGVSPEDVRNGLGVASNADAIDKLNDQVDQFQAGFDKALMLGSFSAKPLTISLPQPKEFWEIAAQSFAASVSMPVKILIGNVTGERASTEDADEWAQTNMSRRANRVIPLLDDLIGRLVRWGALDSKPWTIGWTSLLESSPDDKLARAEKMANINSQQGNEPVFLADEIREEAGYQPGDEVEGFAEWQRERAAQRQQQAEDGQTQTIPDEVQE